MVPALSSRYGTVIDCGSLINAGVFVPLKKVSRVPYEGVLRGCPYEKERSP